MRTRAALPSCRRLFVTAVGTLAMASLLTSCSAAPVLGFRMAPDGQRVQVLVNPCKRSRMHRIVVSEQADPATHAGSNWSTVWEVRSSKGRRLSVATIGIAPPGYEIVTPLQRPLEPRASYVARFGEGTTSYGYFTLHELRRSQVLYDGSYVSEEQYRARAASSCTDPFAVLWTAFYVAGGVGLVLLALVVPLTVHLVRRSKRPFAVLPWPPSIGVPPPPPPPPW